MAENNLEAKITIDVTDLKKGLADAKKAQTDYEKALAETQQAINENNQISREYKKAIDDLNAAYAKNHISTERYNKALARLTRDSKETEVATADLTKKLQDLQSKANGSDIKVANTAKTMSSTATTATQLGKSIGSVTTASTSAGTSVTTLITRFTSLQNSTGSTSAAVKALVGSFAGPAGLALAVSALIPIITDYIKKQDAAGGSSAKLRKETEENNKKLREYLETLGTVSRAQLEGRKGSLDELTTLKLLRGQIEDTNTSMDLRLDGIEKLRKEFPGYFKDISDEQLLNGTATASYNTLTGAIIKRAKATAATQAIVENSKREFDLASQLESVQEKLIKAEEEKTRASNNYLKATKTSTDGGRTALNEQIRQEGIVSDLQKERLRLMQEIGKVQLENQDLAGIAGENAVVTPEFEESKKGLTELEKKLLDVKALVSAEDFELVKGFSLEKLKEYEKAVKNIPNIDKEVYKQQLADAKEAAKVQGGEVAAVLFRETGKLPSPEIFIDVDSEDAFREIVAIEKKLKDIQKSFGEGAYKIATTLPTDQLDAFREKLEVSQGVAQGAALGISSAFDTMSNAVIKTSGETDSALTRFASSLGSSVLKIMATYLSQAVAGAIAGGTSSGAATGPGAVVAIPTMIATLTAAVLGAFAAIPKFASGGIVPGGSFNGDKIPAMLNSGEMVLNHGQQANLFKALDGSLSSLQNKANSDTLVASTVLRGEDIYLSVTRQERIQKRFN